MPLLETEKSNVAAKCTVNDCVENNILARDLCNAHYKKWWRYGDASFIYARPTKKGKVTTNCKSCSELKTIEALDLCKSCYLKQWEAKRPSRRPQRLMREYGLTMEQYETMLSMQENACAICKEKSTKNLHVDHDHETGKVRGLLCYRCNSAIGYLADNPARARDLAEYLEKAYAII